MSFIEDEVKSITLKLESGDRRKKINRIADKLGIDSENYAIPEFLDMLFDIVEKKADASNKKLLEPLEKQQLDYKELQQVHAATKSELQAVKESNQNLIDAEKLLQSRYDTQLQNSQSLDAINAELTKEKESLQSVWTNAQAEIHRLSNEIKNNQLAPNEFIISLSLFQQKCIEAECRENREFYEYCLKLSKQPMNFHVKPITKENMFEVFFQNYYIYSKFRKNGILDSNDLKQAFTKYTK